MALSRIILVALAMFLGAGSPAQAVGADDARVRQFLTKHCVECHGPDAQEAKLRFDDLALPNASGDTLPTWTRIVDAVERREMPPRNQPQPTGEEKAGLVRDVIQATAKSVAQPIAIRRLNRREYEHTVHELLGVDAPLVDLLPEDGTVQGFNKGADGLSISSVLMDAYLKAANVAFDDVVRPIKPRPPEARRLKLMGSEENIKSVKENRAGVIEAADSFVKFTPGWPPARFDDANPIEDGVYRCRIAVWPHQPNGRTLAVAVYQGSLFGPEAKEFRGVFDVTGSPDEPRIIEFTRAMKAKETLHIEPRIWPPYRDHKNTAAKPGVAIAWVETYGPLDQEFPNASTKKLFGDVDTIRLAEKGPFIGRAKERLKCCVVESTQPEADVRRILHGFIPRAFRRPVSEEEQRPYVDLALAALANGATFDQAVRTGVTAVLCSPQFLLANRDPVVDDYTIASRLSYFLWASPPDAELLRLAAEGKLRDPAVRAAQVERMTADPKIQRFVDDFTDQWLDLKDLEFTAPDSKLYPDYDPLLLYAMEGETRRFFAHVLEHDLSVMNFIDSDWTFLNERLAAFYGAPPVAGHEELVKTAIPAESIRGGLLTQAALLKVTANGTNTSPVVRGVWVLDNLLGRPAPPPPPGVPAVEPDIRGATTIREQLEKHRHIAECAGCHKRIDPAGFALEEFDAIGGHRTFYRTVGEGKKIVGSEYRTFRQGLDVESGAELPDGRAFSGFTEFRQRLLEDEPQVARAIATKLLVYATGRKIGLAQRRSIDEVVASARDRGLGLKSMIRAVVENELFLAP